MSVPTPALERAHVTLRRTVPESERRERLARALSVLGVPRNYPQTQTDSDRRVGMYSMGPASPGRRSSWVWSVSVMVVPPSRSDQGNAQAGRRQRRIHYVA